MLTSFLRSAASTCLILCATGCSTDTDPREIRRQNETAQFVARAATDRYYQLQPPARIAQAPYAWREQEYGRYSNITKEYFRCRGSNLNPAHLKETPDGTVIRIADCGGGHSHGLPVIDGVEHIYPVLFELLNEIQRETGRRVAITCGHRCPPHNTYADDSQYNATSKHMVGAEVDFYVQGMEDKPEQVLDVIFRYYQTRFPDDPSLRVFERYEKPDTNVSTHPWYNKEVFIKLFTREEGRDLDNRHPYPYISIQVRWNRETNSRVNYTWQQAHRGYLRT